MRSSRSPKWPRSTARFRTTRCWRSGRSGTSRVLPILAGLQRTAPRESQPGIAAAICLLGVNCASHQPYIVDSLRFAIANLGFQELLRSSASALSVLAVAGREDAAESSSSRERRRAIRPGRRSRWRSAPRAAQRAAGPQVARAGSRPRPGHRVAARSFRHARGGLRRGAVLRDRPPRLLAGPGRFSGASGGRRLDTQARVLEPRRNSECWMLSAEVKVELRKTGME